MTYLQVSKLSWTWNCHDWICGGHCIVSHGTDQTRPLVGHVTLQCCINSPCKVYIHVQNPCPTSRYCHCVPSHCSGWYGMHVWDEWHTLATCLINGNALGFQTRFNSRRVLKYQELMCACVQGGSFSSLNPCWAPVSTYSHANLSLLYYSVVQEAIPCIQFHCGWARSSQHSSQLASFVTWHWRSPPTHPPTHTFMYIILSCHKMVIIHTYKCMWVI